MMNGRILIFTGVGGIIGGLGTLAFGSSCDIECIQDDRPSVIVQFRSPDGSAVRPATASEVTFEHRSHPDDEDAHLDTVAIDPPTERAVCLDEACSRWAIGADEVGSFDIEATICGKPYQVVAEVETDIEGCHAQTQYIDVLLDPAHCDDAEPPPEPQPDPTRCEGPGTPSVVVYVARDDHGRLQPQPVEQVWFMYDGEPRAREAVCAEGSTVDAGSCSTWITAWDKPGDFRVFTKWCGEVVDEAVTVEMSGDGCHVESEVVVLVVDPSACTGDPSHVEFG